MEDLIFETGAIATITINRPKALNALNRAVLEEITRVLRDVRHDTSVRVLIVTGAGDRAFVAGAILPRWPTCRPSRALSSLASGIV